MLILCGYSGSGKSTLARGYAENEGYQVADTDTLLEEKFGQRVRDLHLAWGEARFREEEGGILLSLPATIQVLATGGGILCREENGILLQERGTLVHVQVAPEILWERLYQRALHPAFVQAGYEAFQAHYMERTALYERWCTFCFKGGAFEFKGGGDGPPVK